MEFQITAAASGIYAFPNPPIAAIEANILQTMKAYGITSIAIKVKAVEHKEKHQPFEYDGQKK